MKIKSIVLSLLVSIILASCTPKNIPMADDFSLIFQDDSCGFLPLNILDTEKGVLIHTPLDETESITIPFHLSENELEIIYQKAIAINFFDYPPEVRVRGETPAMTFHLEIRNGAFTNNVIWTEKFDGGPNFPEDDKLIELINLIQQTIRSNSEYQQLPVSKAVCA